MQDERHPVTILSGWLGSGKTTLLNRLLARPGGRRFAVLVNEFGEIGIDDRLVRRTREDLIEFRDGCVCCTVRGDLVASLADLDRRARGGLLRRARPFDHVLIETTGLAEPAPLLRALLTVPETAERFRPASVVTVVDAAHADLALAERTAREQVAVADHLVVTKRDLAAADALLELESRLASMNPLARRHGSEAGGTDDAVLGALLSAPEHDPGRELADRAHHDPEIGSVALREEGALDPQRVRLWLDSCAHLLGDELLRCKGLLHVAGDPRRVLVQGVYTHFELSPEREWGDEPRASEIVFIGRGLDADMLRRGLAASRAR